MAITVLPRPASSSDATKAPLASPTFTGVPAAPTAAAGTNTTQLATTAFVAAAAALKANLASPALTGTPTAPTPALGDNTTKIATMAAIQAAVAALVNGSVATLDTINELAGALNDDPNYATTITNALGLKAPIASPTFTGVPAAPTAAALTNTTQLATTAFVTTADALKANLAGPTFTGVPAAPTAAPGTNTTQLATTAFVAAAVPAGITAKANIASPTFTGVPLSTTPAASDNTTKIATTAFIQTELVAKAPLASPTFTGTPAAPTPAANDNTTKIATSAFVNTAIDGKLGAEVITATGLTLGATHNRGMVTVTATGQTITIPSAATLGFFACDIVADGFSVILNGPGGTDVTLANGEIATVFTSNGKVKVIKGAATVIS